MQSGATAQWYLDSRLKVIWRMERAYASAKDTIDEQARSVQKGIRQL